MANETVDKLKRLQAEARAVLDDQQLARQGEHRMSRFQQFLHFWVLVARSFVRNRCPVRASALAYASLLAMVPILAVVLSVSSSLLKRQGEEYFETAVQRLVDTVTPPAEVGVEGPSPDGATAAAQDTKLVATRKEAAHRINQFVSNMRSGTLGITGVVALMFVAITMLSRIENTFNDIWGISRGRPWRDRVVKYWAALMLGPLLLAVAVGLTSGPQFQAIRDLVAGLPWGVGRLLAWSFKLLPFLILSLAFAVFYQLMPNTKVQWRAALAGGFVGGCLWQVNNLINVLYVSRVVKNSQIYGSLGIVPVFMVGLYFSWNILLFGAQAAYAFQNRGTYLQEKQAEGVNQRSREFVALRLMTRIAACFLRGAPPPTLTGLSRDLGVPSRLAGQVLGVLAAQRLVVETGDGDLAYVPARPLDRIHAGDVLRALRAGQGEELQTREDAARPVVLSAFDAIAEAEQQTARQITLQAMAEQAG